MNANILYDIYETTRKNNANDLTIGLAMYRAEHPETPISQDEDKAIREFTGRHGQKLAAAYQKGREAFAATVAACEAEDAEAEQSGEEAEK